MTTPKEDFVGIDLAKLHNAVAVAIADVGRDGEIRYMGEFDASTESLTRLIRKLAAKHDKLHFVMRRGPLVMDCIGRSWLWGKTALSSHHR
jgi:transposase